jgi:hypothetical protein
MLLKNPLAAGGTQLVHLSVVDLIVGRDTCIADKTFWGRRWIGDLPFCHGFFRAVLCTSKEAFYDQEEGPYSVFSEAGQAQTHHAR